MCGWRGGQGACSAHTVGRGVGGKRAGPPSALPLAAAGVCAAGSTGAGAWEGVCEGGRRSLTPEGLGPWGPSRLCPRSSSGTGPLVFLPRGFTAELHVPIPHSPSPVLVLWCQRRGGRGAFRQSHQPPSVLPQLPACLPPALQPLLEVPFGLRMRCGGPRLSTCGLSTWVPLPPGVTCRVRSPTVLSRRLGACRCRHAFVRWGPVVECGHGVPPPEHWPLHLKI